MPKIYIILLNYNGWKDTVICTESILKNTYKNFKIVIVDNGSPDNSMEFIQKWAKGNHNINHDKDDKLIDYYYPPVKKPLKFDFYTGDDIESGKLKKSESDIILIQTGNNLGFAGGNNYGLKYAIQREAEYVWILNNDTIIKPDSLAHLLETAVKFNNQKIVGSVLYYAHETDRVQAWGGGVINWFKGTTRHLTKPGNVDYLTGASLLIHRDILNSTGLLDEGFFLYWEDADYSIRAVKQNWGLAVAENSMIYHKHNVSSDKVIKTHSDFGDIQTIRGIVRFFFKHRGISGIVPVAYRVFKGVFRRVKRGDFRQFILLPKEMIKALINIKRS